MALLGNSPTAQPLFGNDFDSAQRFNGPGPRLPLHGHQKEPGGQQRQICFHCSVPGHTAKECRLKQVDVVCHGCKVVGHKLRYCPFSNGSVMSTRFPRMFFGMNNMHCNDSVNQQYGASVYPANYVPWQANQGVQHRFMSYPPQPPF